MTHPVIEARCETCRFWVGPNEWASQCRRYPPTGLRSNFNDYGRPAWPMTSPEHWCGEHEPRAAYGDTAPTEGKRR